MLDEVVTGVLVNVISAAGRQMGAGLITLRSHRYKGDIELARWFDTYRLTASIPKLPVLPRTVTAEMLADALQRDEFHSVLHELLAARLTDAPQADIAHIRTSLYLTLAAAFRDTDVRVIAEALFDYYDIGISELVGRLKKEKPALLDKVRQEALAARTISVLHAIERHTAALADRTDPEDGKIYIERYLHHVADYHGKLEPPDFGRRQRVPIADIYVDPVIMQIADVELSQPPRTIDLWTFADEVDRTVLLGDPGGGKTSAAHVLMDYYRKDSSQRIPFMVTLREFAAEEPRGWSVVGYIENKLGTFYQCPPPDGLIERLLLNGTALVIFDGLDELVDTARRADVTAVIEQFSAEYPLARILVTSRLVGYDEARLDERQFVRYRIWGFDENRILGYVTKWFSREDGVEVAEARLLADTFMSESAEVTDLRSNPLMLALMCILYRGEGTMPRSRPEIYEQCSILLFRKWDARRRINIELRTRHLIEPMLRYLAFWLFTRSETTTAVTEQQLIAETARFLHERGFEPQALPEDAAREFIEFCRGRAWVFSDAGTTESGEALYTFTHRTFLEYFAASHLAASCDTPKALARTLLPHVARQEWEVVADLAMQIKDRSSDRGGERVITELLGERRYRSVRSRSNILGFLAHSLRFIDPPAQTIRDLSRCILDHVFSGDPDDKIHSHPLHHLVIGSAGNRDVVASEISERVDTLLKSGRPASILYALRLAGWTDERNIQTQNHSVGNFNQWLWEFWRMFADDMMRRYADVVIAVTKDDSAVKYMALVRGLVTVGDILAPASPDPDMLFHEQYTFLGIYGPPYLLRLLYDLVYGRTWYRNKDTVGDLRSFGQYAMNSPHPPFVTNPSSYGDFTIGTGNCHPTLGLPDTASYLGAALALAIEAEASPGAALQNESQRTLGPLEDLHPYVISRLGTGTAGKLPELTLPVRFRELFHLWANRQVDFASQ